MACVEHTHLRGSWDTSQYLKTHWKQFINNHSKPVQVKPFPLCTCNLISFTHAEMRVCSVNGIYAWMKETLSSNEVLCPNCWCFHLAYSDVDLFPNSTSGWVGRFHQKKGSLAAELLSNSLAVLGWSVECELGKKDQFFPVPPWPSPITVGN